MIAIIQRRRRIHEKDRSRVILIAALSAGTVFGASSTYPLAGNKKFTYWVVLPANVTTYAKNLNEMQFYKALEKATGVKIVFQHPASGAPRTSSSS